ncbi:MAG: alanine dehydrogenase [Rhodocyclaceae bacterium]
MIVGVPTEIKDHEYRAGLTPEGARVLCAAGHAVLVQAGAGARVGFADAAYRDAGARIVADAAALYGEAELVVKVKEPQPAEFALLRAGQILFCYLHLAPDPALAGHLLEAGVSAIAFETVTGPQGATVLLAPMSRIAGRLAPQVGAWALQTANGGSGVLLGGVPGVAAAKVTVIGAGSVGVNAIRIAAGLGAQVTVLDRDIDRLEAIDRHYAGRVQTCAARPGVLSERVAASDLVIGAVLVRGARAPRLVRREDVCRMRPGSVIVDVAIDQGGCVETSRPTSHSEPLFVEEGVVHYCVPNMPSACARTATLALAEATLPYVVALAGLGLPQALARDAGLREGLQVHAGRITHAALAAELARDFVPPEKALGL